jgi:transcriptional regulator with XRE-family HTH domain
MGSRLDSAADRLFGHGFRESAGLTLEAAGPKLDMSRSSLFRVESGETRVTVHLVRSMMDLYDRWEDGLLDAVRAALKPSWFTAYGVRDMGYTDAETEADRVWDYPGMLAVRRIRQQRLTSEDDPLDLVALIDEAAPTREIGGPAVLRAQLDHLFMMAELPTVTCTYCHSGSARPTHWTVGSPCWAFPSQTSRNCSTTST